MTTKAMTTLPTALRAFADGEEPRGPTARELQAALGLGSSADGLYWIHALVRAGFVERIASATTASPTRSYRLTQKGREALDA